MRRLSALSTGHQVVARLAKPLWQSLSNSNAPRDTDVAGFSVVPDAAAESLQGFVRSNVALGSALVTDGWPSYVGLGVSGDYEHTAINLSASDLEAHEELPAVHRVASLLKRWLLGTHQGAVSPEPPDVPRRVHVPLQSPNVTPARAAALPSTRERCGFQVAHLRPARQDTQGQTPGALAYATDKSPARPSPAGDYRAAVARSPLRYRSRLDSPFSRISPGLPTRRSASRTCASRPCRTRWSPRQSRTVG